MVKIEGKEKDFTLEGVTDASKYDTPAGGFPASEVIELKDGSLLTPSDRVMLSRRYRSGIYNSWDEVVNTLRQRLADAEQRTDLGSGQRDAPIGEITKNIGRVERLRQYETAYGSLEQFANGVPKPNTPNGNGTR